MLNIVTDNMVFYFRRTALIIVYAGCLAFLCLTQAAAQTTTWTGSIDSNWNKAGNWNNGIPTSSANVIITTNSGHPFPVISEHDVTVSSIKTNYTGGELTVTNGKKLTITNGLTLNAGGKLYIKSGGWVHLSGGSLNYSYGNSLIEIVDTGHFISDVDMTVKNSGFYAGSGTVTINADLTVATNKIFRAESATVTVAGKTTINGTYDGKDGTTTFKGETNVEGGGVINLNTGTINFNGEASYVGNTGTLNMGSGTVNINSSFNNGGNGTVNVEDGDLEINGDYEIHNGGYTNVDTGSINITGSIEIDQGGQLTFKNKNQKGSMTVGGNASFHNGGHVDAGGSTIDLKGDVTLSDNGSDFDPGTSTVVFSGSGTQTIYTDGQNQNFYNVVVKPGSTVKTDGDQENVITVKNDMTVEDGGNVEVKDDDKIDIQGNLDNQGDGDVQSKEPFVYAISTPSLTTVQVTFDKAMNKTSAETIANYSINKGINITNITLTPADSIVILTVSPALTEGVEYELTINHLESKDGGKISTDHIKRFGAITEITYYSRKTGDWGNSDSWSTESHTGPAASSIPNADDGDKAEIGNNDVISITSTQDISNMEALIVANSGELDVANGGTLTLNNFVITGNGKFHLKAGGTLNIGSENGITKVGTNKGNIQTGQREFSKQGNYVYANSAAQQTGSGLPTQVNDLTIDNTANVTATANIQCSGTLYLQNGALIIPSGQALIANNQSIQNGDLIFKRILSGAPGWRMLSTPVSVTYGQFLGKIITQGYTNSTYSNLQPNVLFYDETYKGTDNQRWRAPVKANGDVLIGRGYNVYLFGDVESDNRYNDPLPDTLIVEGQENKGINGSFNFNVTYTTKADSGWNLVGNPYGAAIDWDEANNWTKTNIDHTIYVWSPDEGKYKTWNGHTGSLGSGRIPPFQAFWIKANAKNPVLKVKKEAKTFGGTFVGRASVNIRKDPKIELQLQQKNKSNTLYFTFTKNALIGKDPSDAYLLRPPPGTANYAELYSISKNDNRFVINNLPRKFGAPIKIPIGARIYQDGHQIDKDVHLVFKAVQNIPPGWKVSLVDRKTGQKIVATPGNSVTFRTPGAPLRFKSAARTGEKDESILQKKYKILAKADPDKARFFLLIAPGADGSGLPEQVKLRQNYPNPASDETIIRFALPLKGKVTLDIYNILGQKITTLLDHQTFSAGFHQINWNVTHFSSGVYIYVLRTKDKMLTKKLTVIR